MGYDGYRVPYAQATYGKEEREAVNEVLDHPESLVGGKFTTEFEGRISTLFGKEHGIMVNSGSSANLLAVELLDAPAKSEVITPLVTFSTTVAPLIQKGLVPTFVDVGIGDYQLDIEQVRTAITGDTVAIMVPSLLGNIPNYVELRTIADEHNLQIIEDSADTLGAKIQGKPTGELSDISTTSFYGSHVITSFGSGGMIAVDDETSMKRLKKLRGWGRSSAAKETDDIEQRLNRILGDVHYDSKFVFDEIGYNFLPTEASAAFGIKQMQKLDSFTQRRLEVFGGLNKFFSEYRKWFVLPKQRSDVETSWLAYPLTIRADAPFDRRKILRHLENNGIQTRSLWSGNLLKHPGFARIDARLPFEDYPAANHIMAYSFVIGAHQAMSDEDVEYVKTVFEDFFDDH